MYTKERNLNGVYKLEKRPSKEKIFMTLKEEGKPPKGEPPKRDIVAQPQTFKRDDPNLYQATWGTQLGTQPVTQPMHGPMQQQLTQPMYGSIPQQSMPIYGPFGEPVATMQANTYSDQDVRLEDWVQQLPPVEPWVHDTGTWNDPSFRGRRGRAMAARGIGRGGRGRARPEVNTWGPFDEGPYVQPPSPLRPQAPPYVPLQVQQQQAPPVNAAPQFAAPGVNQPQPVTPEAVAEMIRAALTQRDTPPMPLLQKPYPEWVDREYELPRGYRIPDFTKFTGDDDQRPTDHLARFELQCGDAGQN